MKFIYLLIEFDEVQKYNVFSLQTNGRVQGELGLGLEHTEEQGCCHVLKVFTCKIILNKK